MAKRKKASDAAAKPVATPRAEVTISMRCTLEYKLWFAGLAQSVVNVGRIESASHLVDAALVAFAKHVDYPPPPVRKVQRQKHDQQSAGAATGRQKRKP